MALVIGGIAAYIAFRQYEVARAKLNLDLFERRYAIFLNVSGFASHVLTSDAPQWNGDAWLKFVNGFDQTEFLFGKELADYCGEMHKAGYKLKTYYNRAMSNRGVMRPEDVEDDYELRIWFSEQAQHGVRARFGEYLNFERWK
ncbi:hypothetical protein A9762_03165 [Pandoraea sp. ISTKB]|nr:hypothetical protein A9762_03165 [Pandoraea sp. ISTKB]